MTDMNVTKLCSEMLSTSVSSNLQAGKNYFQGINYDQGDSLVSMDRIYTCPQFSLPFILPRFQSLAGMVDGQVSLVW